ncbi:YheC/YheD family endospore coat-associated protein [Bacillus sp. Marseille-P3661]|uniref:YheC/YheD family endospore coat-associated protein n=1 Tax=Bacillus sp. Marseille-P3661 TaxID=1936234 RepID=UPI000C825741|nr:YheC/YheD family protein [Bacillus sp. Marseille-P3661]
MTSIGMLHYRKHPDSIMKAYACAAVAKMEGVHFFFFSPGKVNFEKETILGYVFEEGTWREKDQPFPDVIFNATPMKTPFQKEVYRRLKKKIPFTSYPIGNKMKVFKIISTISEFSHFLIPSMKVKDCKQVLQQITDNQRVVMKPLKGNQGKQVFFIEKNNNLFEVIEGENTKTLDENMFNNFIDQLINEKSFLVQPYISCKTKNGFPYDFRIHVQKNGTGQWGITLIYPRIGSKAGIISNISQGGYIAKLESFLEKEFGIEGYDIQQSLEQFAIRFSEHFDKMYKKPLDELGIDIGIDENKKLWIYEVNWRPGYIYRELEAAMNTIPYAVYLASENQG